MKINNRRPVATADVSSARGKTAGELWQLTLLALLLLTAAYFAVGHGTDFVVARVSFEREAALFKDYQVPFARQAEPRNLKYFEKAAAVLDRLKKDPQVPPLPYRLVLIDDRAPNAFAFPGGTIGVTTGLLDALEDEIGIAFVLGHEIGHFQNRDHLHGLGRAIGFRMALTVLFGGTAGAESLGNMADFVLQRHYSREREEQADRYGVQRVHAAYGKTAGIDRLFRVLRDAERLPGWAYMFATHPSPRSRIENLERFAASLDGGESGASGGNKDRIQESGVDR